MIARVIVEVTAAVLPPEVQLEPPRPTGTHWQRNRPLPEHTRRFVVTSEEWEKADDDVRPILLAEVAGKASGYATLLMLQPGRFNHVRVEWIWL